MLAVCYLYLVTLTFMTSQVSFPAFSWKKSQYFFGHQITQPHNLTSNKNNKSSFFDLQVA